MKFYRYVAQKFASINDDINLLSIRFNSNVTLSLYTYNLHKETPKGYWIGYGHPDNGLQSDSIWVSKTAKKRYAYPTRAEALTNYIKRTERRIKILKSQLDFAEVGLMKGIKLEEENGDQKFFKDDVVKLPFDEVGIVESYQELVWGSKYYVKITKSNGFNDVDEVVDYFENQLELE